MKNTVKHEGAKTQGIIFPGPKENRCLRVYSLTKKFSSFFKEEYPGVAKGEVVKKIQDNSRLE